MFISNEILEKCLDAFEFDSLGKYMNHHNLSFSGYEDNIEPVELYKYVRDILRFANNNFNEHLDKFCKIVRNKYKEVNAYIDESGIFVIELQAVLKQQTDYIEYITDNRLIIEFKQNISNKDDRWVDIKFVLFGQFPGYLA